MAAAIVVPLSFFLTVFAITYLFLSTRNKERLALIEKGADANIFMRQKSGKPSQIWKVVLLNIAALLMSIGLGIFIASILSEMRVPSEVAYPGAIFFMAGTGLLAGYALTKKLDKED